MRPVFALLLTLAFTLPSKGRVASQPPASLTVVDWSQLRAEYDRHRHTAFPDGEGFKAWQKEHELIRGKDEPEIDFARRVFTTIRKEFTYDYQPEMDRTPPAVCQMGKSDCGGLSNLFVATLRSQGVPARTLAGRWAISANPNEKLNGHAYYQYHVKAEFFAAGVGWVPVDMASGILHDRSREGLYYFGFDPGDFLTQHIDSNLEMDTVHFGKQQIVVLQRPAFWVTGTGTLDDVMIVEGWTVSKTPR